MEKRSMELLVEAGKDLGLEINGREAYSGRGMYGRTTAAVTAENASEVMAAIAQATRGLAQLEKDEEIDEFIEDLRGLRADSMGLGVVLY